MATVFNAPHGVNEYGQEITYRLNGSINVKGFPEVGLKNTFVPAENGQPAATAAPLSLGERFEGIDDNPYNAPRSEGRELFSIWSANAAGRVWKAPAPTLAKRVPGDQIIVETVLAPYRGERVVRQISVKIPTSASKGTLRILVSDGETLDRVGRTNPAFGPNSIWRPPLPCSTKSTSTIASTFRCLKPTRRGTVWPTKSCPRCRLGDERDEGHARQPGDDRERDSNVDDTCHAAAGSRSSGAHLLTVTVK